jgi:hypothetical protein
VASWWPYGNSRSLITQEPPRRMTNGRLSSLGRCTWATSVPEQRRASVVCIRVAGTIIENRQGLDSTVILTWSGRVVADALPTTITAAVAANKVIIERMTTRRFWAARPSQVCAKNLSPRLRRHSGTLAQASALVGGGHRRAVRRSKVGAHSLHGKCGGLRAPAKCCPGRSRDWANRRCLDSVLQGDPAPASDDFHEALFRPS